MGKSGGRKKKAGGTGASAEQSGGSVGNKVDLDVSLFLKKAHELKEEGNTKFQNKDYVGALEQYEQALKLMPRNHPDRAVFHSNRAACLMQMKPVQYDVVVNECTLALEVHPRFSRALFRRARAYEGMGKLELAMQDLQALLQVDSNHQDALEHIKRLRVALGNKQDAQPDLQNRPTMPSFSGTSPAAVGASAVRGTPVGGMGPCLPARPVPKKKNKQDRNSAEMLSAQLNGPSLQEIPLPKSSASPSSPGKTSATEFSKVSLKVISENGSQDHKAKCVTQPVKKAQKEIKWRPLKLIFDHDIRLAQMPENCKFKELREIVRKRFSSSKAVLIKYSDLDGDKVTITSTEELRLAESAAAQQAEQKNTVNVNVVSAPSGESNVTQNMPNQNAMNCPLKLYVVEVNPEQEPLIEEEEEPVLDGVEDEDDKVEENISGLLEESNDGMIKDLGKELNEQVSQVAEKYKNEDDSQLEGKEIEIDDWIFEFAQLFRTHVGIDPDAHVDLHELGMELCSEALEETVTSEEAQHLFDMAACKFQEVAALAFFNWGNVYMCAARKRIPLDESSSKEQVLTQLQVAYDWVQDQYLQAGKKYDEALRIKPDFYEGLLALGQQRFETAKLRWSLALASKVDLGTWDSSETIELFNNAEEKMQMATEMWEKLEEQRQNELKDPSGSKKDEILKRKRKHSGNDNGDSSEEIAASALEAAEQATLMRSQIHLFWGNILFERSQVEFKLGFQTWKEHLDAAVERFKLAGASSPDIEAVLKNHSSNATDQESKDTKTENAIANVANEEEKVDDMSDDKDKSVNGS